ncbi:DNA mismatch repair protein [Marasmius crinis-equi]|uniref:DNA mismatch repair protein n=1 Tax=Marasmius crinis-equi TaxID=585013 RepID=A0ABR3FWZ3_9AGAR
MADLPIEKLPVPTRHKLRSTQILTSLPQIVSELFQNSLDAGARHVEVGVDCEDWMCWITDDGHGISKDGLSLLSTAERYGSSKAYTPDTLNVLSTFGFRGEALASAADLGCLEISSRTSRSKETWSLILKDGKTIYLGAAVRWKRTSHGTTVCVRDAFYNLPVRRFSHPSPARAFEMIRKELETYALVFPNVSFSLRLTSEAVPKENMIRLPKNTSMLNVFRHLYGKALCQHVHQVDVQREDLRLEGFISLDGALSRVYQFLCLFIRMAAFLEADLYARRQSSFAKHAYEESGETSLRPSTRRSPRKAEKKAVYVLNVTIPPDKLDNLLEPAKSVVHLGEKNAVESLLASTVDEFLIRYGFSLPTPRRGNEGVSPSPRKRRRLDPVDDSGYAEEFSEEINGAYDSENEREVPKIDVLYIGDIMENGQSSELGSEIVWTDNATGQTFIVDRRTGHSRLRGDCVANSSTPVVATHRERRTLPPPKIGDTSGNLETPDWIRKALEANECYALGEKRIRSLNHITRHDQDHDPDTLPRGQIDRPTTYSFRAIHSSIEHGNESMRHSFTREDVRGAVVINQVDRKFVACAFNGSEEDEMQRKTLVLIDQHAADERVRVELLLRDLCFGFLRNIDSGLGEQENAVEIRHLTPPVPILLTRVEERRLSSSQEVRDAFWSWGICFANPTQIKALDHGEVADSLDGDDSGSYAQIAVEYIPEVVADKLLSADELRDMVKSFLAQVDSDHLLDVLRHRPTSRESEDRKESDWLKALRWCPRHLLELVNSKACRGAIMFNDPLSNEQCERLVKQLSETSLPFQCAHGRPSLVPLTDFGRLAGDRGKYRLSQVNWSALEEQTHPD